MAKHDFGIIERFEDDKLYSDYEPEKYNCISVSDDLIEEMITEYLEELGNLKTYFHMKKHPALGLDYCGTTIIPPGSLKEFRKIITTANKQFKSNELEKYHFSKDGKIPTETLDKIIENFADAQAFDANYKLVTEKDGEKIKMQEIERSKSQERDDR